MSNSLKTYVKTVARHHRVMIFVDSKISEKGIRAMMEALLHIWGGRYTPIVPVYDNIIPESWLELIKHYDPDYIYYSAAVSIGYLKSLNLFQPKEYKEYKDEDNRYHFPGVNIHNLLHEHIEESLQNERLSVLQYNGKWSMEMVAKEFYQLNLGFKSLYAGENKWLNNYKLIEIDENNAANINQLIYETKPFFKTILAGLHINSIRAEANATWQLEQFEWIIYQPANFLSDLLYFWNRQLYIQPQNNLGQVVSTLDEFNALVGQPYFEGLLYRISQSHSITLVSKSLSENELEDVKAKAQQVCNTVRLQLINNAEAFPFKPHRFSSLSSTLLKQSNNLLLGKTDFLRYPSLSFENNDIIKDGIYVIDAVIERDTSDEHKEIKFPYGTCLHHLVCKEPARVNKLHRVSIYVNNSSQGAEFNIPSDVEIIKMVLSFRQFQNDLITLPVEYLSYSNSGQKLSAFYNLFECDWSIIKQLLEEQFWLQLFMSDSEIQDSAIKSGRGIFSYQDLIAEIDGLFIKYREQVTLRLKRGYGNQPDIDVIERIIARNKKECFEHYIDRQLADLIKSGGLLLGMKVSCRQCGANKWYSLGELNDKIHCKGCSGQIMPNIDSSVYYKLSEIIINNLKSDPTKSTKHFDGNYVVMKTLLNLKNDFQLSGNSFIWSAPIDYSISKQHNAKPSDFDILAIQNGKLIIGEAKSSSGDFNNKEIGRLIWIGNNLMPDKIIVACNSGTLETTVEKVKAGINNSNCEVISYTASKPWYHFSGLFGLPKNIKDMKGDIVK